MAEYLIDQNESENDFFVRVGQGVLSKDITWTEAAGILNRELNKSKAECAWRKAFKNFYRGMTYQKELDALSPSETEARIRAERNELEMERVKCRDERTELRRLLREQARQDEIFAMIGREVKSFNPDCQFRNVVQYDGTGKELLVVLSDLHTGAGINNAFNKFDSDVLRERLGKYVAKVINIVGLHQPQAIRIVLCGDMINGIIHVNGRLSNKENAIEQVITASELISNFVAELHRVCNNIYVYSVSGNHSRIFPNKEEAVVGEDLDSIIPFYMKARLSELDGITIVDDKTDPTFGCFEAMGLMVCYAHGDRDTPENIVQKITMMIKRQPDICLMGHRHSNGMRTVYNSKVIESGCVCGTDQHAIGLRLSDAPQQAVVVIDSSGVDCVYDVKL